MSTQLLLARDSSVRKLQKTSAKVRVYLCVWHKKSWVKVKDMPQDGLKDVTAQIDTTITVWLAVGDDHMCGKWVLSAHDAEDAEGELEISNEMIFPPQLELVVEFDRKNAFFGRVRVPLGCFTSADSCGSTEVNMTHVTDVKLCAEVENWQEFQELVNLQATPSQKQVEEKKEREKWLGDLKTYAKEWEGWSGPNVFLYYFDPACTIASDAMRKRMHIPWLAGQIENLVAGPGVVYAVHWNIAVSVFQCFVFFVFGFALLPGCVAPNVPVGHVVQAPWTLYILYVPVMFCKLYCELAVLGCLLPVKVLGLGVPTVPIPFTQIKWSLRPWLWMKLLGSMAAGLDAFSSAVFLSRVVAEERVTRDQPWTMEDPWLYSLQVSRMGWFWEPIREEFGYPTFKFLAFVLWMTVLLQIVWALGYSLPISKELQRSQRPPQHVLYDTRYPYSRDDNMGEKRASRKEMGVAYRQKKLCRCDFWSQSNEELLDKKLVYTDFAEYHTPLISFQVHGRALVALLKSARLSMGTALDTEYVVLKAKYWKPKNIYNYQRQSGHFFIIFMIQRVLTTSLQASFLGISKNLRPHDDLDWLTFMNVVLGCMLGWTTIYSEVNLHRKLFYEIWCGAKASIIDADFKAGKPHSKRIRRDLWWQRFWSAVSLISTSLFSLFSVLLLLYCVQKAYTAFACPCGLVNVDSTSSPWSVNCVDFMEQGEDHCILPNWTRPNDTLGNLSLNFGLEAGSLSNSSFSGLCRAFMLE